MNRDECWDSVDVSGNDDDETNAKSDRDQFVCESFTDKLYVPRRSYWKYVKPWHAALAVAVIVFIIIVIAVSTSAKKESVVDKEKDSLKYASSLIICDKSSCSNYNYKEKRVELIQKTEGTIGSFDFYKDATFWSEPNATKILSGNRTNGKRPDVVFDDSRFQVQAMAVDHFTGKLYAVDKITGTAIVVDLQNKRYGILMTDLKQPEDILLDPSKGLLFILQPTESIVRSNMDGTSIFEIIRSTIYITAITLDHANKLIYGIYNYNTILRTDYGGMNREVMLKDHVSIISLAVSDDRLFWLWPRNDPHNATLWSCQIQGSDCQDHRIESASGLANATSIKSISHRGSVDSTNPCVLHKNICQHMCLLSSVINAGRSCGCYVGWEPRTDPRSCQPVEEFLLYVIGSTVRGRILNFDKDSFTEAFLPTKLNLTSLNQKGTVDFDYDVRNDTFYFSDDLHIYRMHLKRPSNQTIMLSTYGSYYIEDLAFDGPTTSLYYSNCTKSKSSFHYLTVKNVTETRNIGTAIKAFSYRDGFGLNGCPYGTVIDEQERNVFFSAEDYTVRSIYRTSLNGTRLKMDTKKIEYVDRYRLLAIDQLEKRLYWIHRSGLETVLRSVNYDGSNEKFLHVTSVSLARTVYVHGDYMYLSNELSIMRGNKTSGKDFVRVIPRTGSDMNEHVSAIKIVNMTSPTTEP